MINYQTVVKEVKEALVNQDVTVKYYKHNKNITINTTLGEVSFPLKDFIRAESKGTLKIIYTKNAVIWNFTKTGTFDVNINL